MENLLSLQIRLQKIDDARRLNAKMREILKKKLQIIDSQIYVQTTPKNKLEQFYYEVPKLWGFTNFEYTKLSQIFWGRTYKKDDEKITYPKSLKKPISMKDKRLLFINQYRSSRQKALLLTTNDNLPIIFSKQQPILPPIRIKPYSIHDVIRFYIFTKIYGKNFPISTLYPPISASVMKTLLKSIMNDDKEIPTLESIGIDPEMIQNYLSTTLVCP